MLKKYRANIISIFVLSGLLMSLSSTYGDDKYTLGLDSYSPTALTIENHTYSNCVTRVDITHPVLRVPNSVPVYIYIKTGPGECLHDKFAHFKLIGPDKFEAFVEVQMNSFETQVSNCQTKYGTLTGSRQKSGMKATLAIATKGIKTDNNSSMRGCILK